MRRGILIASALALGGCERPVDVPRPQFHQIPTMRGSGWIVDQSRGDCLPERSNLWPKHRRFLGHWAVFSCKAWLDRV